ncbi:MAG: hypothetical protein KAH06_09700, partial [Desulfobacterales bacterium]|nr:hypothetical protein [Desulfobacterales bacterium]
EQIGHFVIRTIQFIKPLSRIGQNIATKIILMISRGLTAWKFLQECMYDPDIPGRGRPMCLPGWLCLDFCLYGIILSLLYFRQRLFCSIMQNRLYRFAVTFKIVLDFADIKK